MPAPNLPPPLRTLFLLLERGGFPVTPRHYLMLAHVYGLAPAGGGDQLQRVLRSLLVKRPEERERFDRLFDQWLEETGERLRRAESLPEPPARESAPPGPQTVETKRPTRKPEAGRRRRTRLLFVAAATALLALAFGLYFWSPADDPDPKPGPVTDSPPEVQPPEIQQTDLRERTVPLTLPSIRVEPVTPFVWPWLATALAGLGLLAWLLHNQDRWAGVRRAAARTLSEAAGTPTASAAQPAAPPGPLGGLLDPAQRKALVWGVQKFRSDLPAPDLDLEQTVDATARDGGIVHPVFARLRLDRRLWLWIDDSSADATADLLAQELAGLLLRAGIPAEQARFWAAPDRLLLPDGRRLRPHDLEQERDAISVLIFTDGRRLLPLLQGPHRRELLPLLERLGHWPRITLVDFSEDGRMTDLAARYHLECVAPGALAAHLGQDPGVAVDSGIHEPWGAAGIWAAACALAPDGTDLDTARSLAGHLGLEPPPWTLRTLLNSGGEPRRLRWPLEQRAEWLAWLTGLGGRSGDTVTTGGALEETLLFWERHYAGRLDALADRHTPEALDLRLQAALVRLWNDPARAAAELDRLAAYRAPGAKESGGPFEQEVRRHLARHRPADRPGPGLIALPWDWSGVLPEVRHLLRQLGLGGELPQELLQAPGRYRLAQGAAAGAAAAALGLIAWTWLELPTAPPELPPGGAAPVPHALVSTGPTEGTWDVRVVHPQGVTQGTAPAGTRLDLTWRTEQRPCIKPFVIETRDGGTALPGAERRRCGRTLPSARLAGPAIPRSLALLWTGPQDAGAEALADRLLSGGSADQVLLAPPSAAIDTKAPLSVIETAEHTRLLIFGPADTAPPAALAADHPGPQAWIQVDDWQAAADRLAAFDGDRGLDQVFGESARILTGDPADLHLGGVPDTACRTGETFTHQPSGIVFVHLCGERFLMGDDSGGNDEKPAHTVDVPEFWLARTETSNDQFLRFRPDHESEFKEDEQPVQNVDWNAARAFCASLGEDYRLPSEAEWEYAARAGTTGKWSFGDEEALLEQYAVYGRNYDKGPEPVGSRKPNPWGLYDLHGNVWEWVEDQWHDNYKGAPDDGSAWLRVDKSDESERVLRGGSFGVSAAILRSAFRFWVGASVRDWSDGFRCARSARQP